MLLSLHEQIPGIQPRAACGHAYQTDNPGGYLRSVLPEHTDQITPCGYDYARKYRTFSPGRPANMRTGPFPWRITALDHTGHLAPGGEPRYCTRASRAHCLGYSLARAYRIPPRAALTTSVTDRYTAPSGTKTGYCTRTRQMFCLGRRWHTVHFPRRRFLRA